MHFIIKKFLLALSLISVITVFPVTHRAQAQGYQDDPALIAQLQAQIQVLIAQLQALIAAKAVMVAPSVPNEDEELTGVSLDSVDINLTLGVTNKEVTDLQNNLKGRGFYNGPITGYFGTLTFEAVKKFQAAYAIKNDGNVGPQTREKLNDPVTPPTQPTVNPPINPTTNTAATSTQPVTQRKSNCLDTGLCFDNRVKVVIDDVDGDFIDSSGLYSDTKILNYLSPLISSNTDFLFVFKDWDAPIPPLPSNAYFLAYNKSDSGFGMTTRSTDGTNLKGMMIMPNISTFSDPETKNANVTTFTHEFVHYWLAYFNDPKLRLSSEQFKVHYDQCLALTSPGFNDPMYEGGAAYSAWQETSPGSYTSTWLGNDSYKKKYSSLSLYAMGAIPASEVEPINLIKPDNGSSDCINSATVTTDSQGKLVWTLKGTSRKISLSDITAVYGDRTPAYPNTQRSFNVQIALLAHKNSSLTQTDIARFKQYLDEVQNYLPFVFSGKLTFSIIGGNSTPPPPPPPTQPSITPVMSVSSNNTLSWTNPTNASGFTIAEIRTPYDLAHRTYPQVTGTTYDPTDRPGETVRYSVSANGSGVWSNEISITYTGTPVAQIDPPKLRVENNVLKWDAVAGATSYVVVDKSNNGEGYYTVSCCSFDPYDRPGQTARYSIRANPDNGWSSEVTITYSSSPAASADPILSVASNNTLTWTNPRGASGFTIAEIRTPYDMAHRAYPQTTGTSYDPTDRPGETVRYSISANGSGLWSSEVSITYARTATVASIPPTLRVDGNVIKWDAVSGATGYYIVEILPPYGMDTRNYIYVGNVTSYDPTDRPGQTVRYGSRTDPDNGYWASEVSITYGGNSSAAIQGLNAAAAITASQKITKTLQRGDSGSEIAALQQFLKSRKMFSDDVSGYFGPMTEAAVMTYQSQKSLEVVGIVGPQTRTAINTELGQ